MVKHTIQPSQELDLRQGMQNGVEEYIRIQSHVIIIESRVLSYKKKCKHNGLTAIIIISRQAGRQATNHMQSKHNHPWWYTYIFVFTAK